MTPPTAADVLAWIAAESPWFPARHARIAGQARSLYDQAIGDLLQAGLIEAREWVKDQGQGFALTDEGERVARAPAVLPRLLAGESQTPDATRLDTTFDRGERARQSYYYPRRAVLTQLLVAANIVVFAVGYVLARQGAAGGSAFLTGRDGVTAARIGAVSGDLLARGQWWRLETANFVHFGYLHLLLNVASLAVVGALAENLWGRWRFAVIYLTAGLAGCSLAMMLRPGTLVAGASCAIWGLTASLLVWIVQYRQHFRSDIMTDFARRIGFAIALNAVFSFLPNVSWEGHLGGALGGAAMAVALDWIRPGHRRRTRAGLAASIALPIAIVATLLTVALRSHAWRPYIEREKLRQMLDQHQHYLKQLQPDLDAIGPHVAWAFVADTKKAGQNITRYPKLEARAKELQEKAAALRERIQLLGGGPPLDPGLPQRADDYCQAFSAFMQRMYEMLLDELKDPNLLADARLRLDESWSKLHAIEWP